jgi:multiple sugar transport system ATP-binding protein
LAGGRVTLLESLGSAFLVTVEGEGVRLQVTVPEGRQPEVGAAAWVAPDPERVLVYRRQDGALVGPAALTAAAPPAPGRGAGRSS